MFEWLTAISLLIAFIIGFSLGAKDYQDENKRLEEELAKKDEIIHSMIRKDVSV